MSVVFKTLISRIKNRYEEPQITYSTGTIPSTSRHHLAHQIEESLGDDRSIVNQLDDTLASTMEKLRIMEESEQFLGTRIRKYRKMLADHQMRINSDESGMDEAEKERQLKQQDQLQLKICDVIDTHKSILREVEILRRKLNDLERKRDDLKEKQNQCEEFLIASVELDLDDDGDDAVVMEMGVLNRIEPSQLEIS
jgi:chromosome segregation ATPase